VDRDHDRSKALVLNEGSGTGQALSVLLASAGFEVVETSSGEEALSQAAAEKPAIVLLDLDDRDTSGYLVCKLLRERYGELLPIVFLSGSKVEASDRVVGLLIGADDYVVKPYNASEFVARLRRLLARSTAHAAEAALPAQGEEADDFDLTKRERQVMALLLKGLTQAEIASELVISSNTVATHIQRILLKLDVHNRAQAVAKVARAGWLQRELEAEQPAASARLEEAAEALRRERSRS
jgi:DNA-binding NarL/FixJ family response regulator